MMMQTHGRTKLTLTASAVFALFAWISSLETSLDSTSLFVRSATAASVENTEDRSLLAIPPPDFASLEEAVQERLREAQADFASVTQNPDIADGELGEAYGEMGRLFHAHHLYDPAEAYYRNAQILTPQDFRWPYLLGYLYQASAQFEKAAQSYDRALHIRPDYAPAQLRLAQVYLGLNQPAQAEPLLQSALAEEGLKGAVAFELGKAASSRGEFEKAVEWFEQARKAQPKASRIHYPLAMAYRALGDIANAQRHLKQRGDVEAEIPDPWVDELQQLLSGARTHQYRAMKAVWAKQFDLAAKEFREIVRLEPDNIQARVSLARALYMEGDRDGTHEQLRAALARQPNHDRANYFMGRLLEERGSGEAAWAHYRTTLASNPEHGGAHFFLANALMWEGNYAQAAQHYAKVVDVLPEDLSARLMEAMALVATAQAHKEARERLQEALAVHPGEPRLTQALARLLAASPDDEVRDGAQALSLAKTLFDQVNSIGNAETVAMAYAELARYATAAAYQQAAIDAALLLGGFDVVAKLNANLDLYQKGKPCRSPWPNDDPIFHPSRFSASGPGLGFSPTGN